MIIQKEQKINSSRSNNYSMTENIDAPKMLTSVQICKFIESHGKYGREDRELLRKKCILRCKEIAFENAYRKCFYSHAPMDSVLEKFRTEPENKISMVWSILLGRRDMELLDAAQKIHPIRKYLASRQLFVIVKDKSPAQDNIQIFDWFENSSGDDMSKCINVHVINAITKHPEREVWKDRITKYLTPSIVEKLLPKMHCWRRSPSDQDEILFYLEILDKLPDKKFLRNITCYNPVYKRVIQKLSDMVTDEHQGYVYDLLRLSRLRGPEYEELAIWIGGRGENHLDILDRVIVDSTREDDDTNYIRIIDALDFDRVEITETIEYYCCNHPETFLAMRDDLVEYALRDFNEHQIAHYLADPKKNDLVFEKLSSRTTPERLWNAALTNMMNFQSLEYFHRTIPELSQHPNNNDFHLLYLALLSSYRSDITASKLKKFYRDYAKYFDGMSKERHLDIISSALQNQLAIFKLVEAKHLQHIDRLSISINQARPFQPKDASIMYISVFLHIYDNPKYSLRGIHNLRLWNRSQNISALLKYVKKNLTATNRIKYLTLVCKILCTNITSAYNPRATSLKVISETKDVFPDLNIAEFCNVIGFKPAKKWKDVHIAHIKHMFKSLFPCNPVHFQGDSFFVLDADQIRGADYCCHTRLQCVAPRKTEITDELVQRAMDSIERDNPWLKQGPKSANSRLVEDDI